MSDNQVSAHVQHERTSRQSPSNEIRSDAYVQLRRLASVDWTLKGRRSLSRRRREWCAMRERI